MLDTISKGMWALKYNGREMVLVVVVVVVVVVCAFMCIFKIDFVVILVTMS